MNSQKFISGSIAGGIVHFFLGYLFYGVLLKDFFTENGEPATDMANLVWWALILGNLFAASLLTYILLKAGISRPSGGASTGFVVGLLLALSFDLIAYGVHHQLTLKAIGANIAISAVISAVAGAVIGWVLGMGKKAATA